MTHYIKMLILALCGGIIAPLPVSSAAHFSFLNTALEFTTDEGLLSFYYFLVTLAFSVVIFLSLRKIYFKAFSLGFKSSKADPSVKPYKKVLLKSFLTLIPALVLFVPVSGDGTLLIDYFSKFMASGGLLLSAFASIISAFIIVIAMWYTKQKKEALKRSASTKTTLRMAIYEIVTYVVPGVSKVALGSVNMLICDIDPKVIMREVYLYLAPQMFLVSAVGLIRGILADLVIDPVLALIAFLGSALIAAVIVKFVSRVNMRKLLGFFAAYSAVFGAFVGIMSFLI